MNWVRCVRCRTVGDRSRDLACPGCGTVYPSEAPAAECPQVERDAGRAVSFANRLMWALGALAGAGLIGIALAPSDEDSMIAAALASVPVFILLSVVFCALVVRGVGRTQGGLFASLLL